MGKLSNMKKNGSGIPVRKEAAPVLGKAYNYADVRLDDIQLNANNDFSKEDTPEMIEQLADSIARQGMDHNIVLSRRADGTLMMLSGERRLKAFKLLRNDEKQNANGQYDRIHAKIYDGLDELEELIVLDETNLEVRGNLGNPEIQRKTMVRYVENLKKKYGISQAKAQKMLESVSNASPATIYRNMRLSFQLIPELQEFLSDTTISRSDIQTFCSLNEKNQQIVSKALSAAQQYLEEEGENARPVRDAVIKSCVEAAGNYRDGDPDLNYMLLTEHVEIARRKSKEQPVQLQSNPPKATALDKKNRLIAKYNKYAADLAKASKGHSAKGMCALENIETEESIVESLENLITQAQNLINAIKIEHGRQE